ncbi:MAG: DUF3391 domain-containing protein [Burkholderiales bacterium]|nr:DUF3391 domain-containing protein [Burkholderiales bacterium]
MMSKQVEQADAAGPYVLPEQLRVGLYVHLDLSWTEHPFTFSSFKIKTQDQIATIQSLGLKRIRYVPDKSDGPPLAPPPANAPQTKTSLIPPPPKEDEQALSNKRERLQKLSAQRAKASACEKQLVNAAKSVKSMAQGLFTHPEEVKETARLLVEGIASSMLVEADVSIQLMADRVGHEDVYHHALNVALLSMMLAKELKAPAQTVQQVGIAALFHDIGEAEIPPRILKSTDPLSKAELSLYHQHPEYGVKIGQKMGLPPDVLQVIAQHHERVDGSGYPANLRAAQMSLLSRIVSLVNAYDELCNPHNLAKALTPHEALSTLFSQHRAQFDPLALSTFVRCMGVYPPGTIVVLSNGATGLVVSQNTTKPLRPVVLIYDPAVPKEEAILVDLETEPDVSVTKAMRPQQLSPEALAYLSPRKRTTYFFDSEK